MRSITRGASATSRALRRNAPRRRSSRSEAGAALAISRRFGLGRDAGYSRDKTAATRGGCTDKKAYGGDVVNDRQQSRSAAEGPTRQFPDELGQMGAGRRGRLAELPDTRGGAEGRSGDSPGQDLHPADSTGTSAGRSRL